MSVLQAPVADPSSGEREHAFSGLRLQSPDPLLSLIRAYREDPRSSKLDLGVGVYRDAQGDTPVFAAVKEAERRLLNDQTTKAYLGTEGDTGFLDGVARLILGGIPAGLTAVQTPGGTGALRLAADLAVAGRSDARIWVGEPTWPIHTQIFAAAGLSVSPYAHLDTSRARLNVEAVTAAMDRAAPGDLVLLHGCGHNPSGVDLTIGQWRDVAARIERRGLVPLIDLAYHGLAEGLDADAQGARLVFDAAPTAILAYSCDKNFGLYRERTGALFVKADRHAEEVRSNLLGLARCLWSMPPDHGAAVVRVILEDAALTTLWKTELEAMRLRLHDLRAALADAEPRLEAVRRQRGLFSLLPLSPEAVRRLRDEHAVYMAGSGRINVAGLSASTLDAFVHSLSPFLNEADA